MICYHHNDLDGKAAANCVHLYKPSGVEDTPYSYFQRTYNDEFDKHTRTDDVVIVDLSFTVDNYTRLIDICNTARSVTWIDHHKSSVDVVTRFEKELQSIRNLTYFVSDCACGAALTYVYFNCINMVGKMFSNKSTDSNYRLSATAGYDENDNTVINFSAAIIGDNSIPDTKAIKLPLWLKYVDDYDCWKKHYKETDLFTLGCDSSNTAFTYAAKAPNNKYWSSKTRVFNEFWTNMVAIDGFVSNLVAIGGNVFNYIHSRYHRELKHSFVWDYEGDTFICINGTGNSWKFEELIEKYPAGILFYYDGSVSKWCYSVYSHANSTFDCEAFAKKFAGGGHLHAAGFSTEKLIFTSSDYAPRNEDNNDRTIFLGGTVDDYWRQEFIKNWKDSVSDRKDLKDIDLFDPIVDDWNEEAQKKENEVKSSAFVNLFVITPKTIGAYSIAEAIECSHNSKTKVIFVMYDKYNEGFSADNSGRVEKSFRAIGDLIKSHNGEFVELSGSDSSKKLVAAVIEAIGK